MSITVISNADPKPESAKVEVKAIDKKESAPAETETQEVEAKADETADESDASEEQEADSEDQDQEDERPKKQFKGVQKRIDKLTKRAAAAEREKEYWREQALNSQQKPEQKREESSAKPEEKSESMPEADDFENHSDYIRAVAKWEIRQELNAEKAKERETNLKSEYEQKKKTFADQLKKVSKVAEDYSDVMAEVADDIVPASVQAILFDSEDGGRLIYELAKNPEHFKKVMQMSPLQAAREIGKVEARLSNESESKKETKEIKTTKAPKPVSPVGSKASGSTKKTIFDPDLSQADYERLRREQMGG